MEIKELARIKAEKGKLSDWLYRVGQNKGAATQLKLCDVLISGDGAIPTLADTILCQQHQRISEWGERAFPLSEKQCEAIAREFS